MVNSLVAPDRPCNGQKRLSGKLSIAYDETCCLNQMCWCIEKKLQEEAALYFTFQLTSSNSYGPKLTIQIRYLWGWRAEPWMKLGICSQRTFTLHTIRLWLILVSPFAKTCSSTLTWRRLYGAQIFQEVLACKWTNGWLSSTALLRFPWWTWTHTPQLLRSAILDRN